jgi:acetyl esterase/lipase
LAIGLGGISKRGAHFPKDHLMGRFHFQVGSVFRVGFVLAALCMILPELLPAQTVPAGKSRLFLWGNRKAPIASPRPSGISDTGTYSKTDSVRNSWLLHYAPTTDTNGSAIIVIPGGGYDNLSPWTSEGTPAAATLTGYGITVFILRYRVKPYGYPHQMWDVQRAVRWVRANAAAYKIDPNRIGVLGFSAGGHVASTVATHFDAGLLDSNATNGPHWYPGLKDAIDVYSSRPNFQGLIYPMITMVQWRPGTTNDDYAYKAGRDIYIGTSPSQSLIDYTSNEKQVTSQTPPAFLNYGTNDATVDTLNSAAYRDSLKSKGVPVKVVVVAGGTHNPSTAKLDSLRAWMNVNGFLSPTAIHPGRARTKIPAQALVPYRQPDARGRVSDRPVGPVLAVPASENRKD